MLNSENTLDPDEGFDVVAPELGVEVMDVREDCAAEEALATHWMHGSVVVTRHVLLIAVQNAAPPFTHS